MISNLPFYISIIFAITTAATLLILSWAFKNSDSAITQKQSTVVIVIGTAWLMLQAFLTLNNVYNSDHSSVPPKLMLFGVLPMILLIVLLFLTSKGREFIDSLPLKTLTYLHIIRIPVELVLYWLFLYKAVPQLMTFEGRNFDILAGITAPFIAYFGFSERKLSRQGVLIWNFISLALLANIVINAVLSAPWPMQTFAFDQPNLAVLYFPFSWLPAFIVPVVLFSHLASIRQLMKQINY